MPLAGCFGTDAAVTVTEETSEFFDFEHWIEQRHMVPLSRWCERHEQYVCT